jgi:hypothetical protein
MRRTAFYSLSSAFALSLLLSPACSDEGEDDEGTGGAGSTTSTTSPATTTTGSPASTTGGSTTGGDGGGGGTGGGTGDCLAPSAYAAYFTIDEATLCAVATYTAEGLSLDGYGATPSWGSHGGPLTMTGSDTMLTLRRWSRPSDGVALSVEDSSTPVTVQAGAFWGGLAVDVSTTTTVAAWTGTPFMTQGGLVAVEGGDAVQASAIGAFGIASSQGRVLFTGLSAAGQAVQSDAGLYGALATPAEITDDGNITAWGLATGPVAVDEGGYAFAVMTDYLTGTQEVRGYDVDEIQVNDPPAAGVTLASLPGFGDAMAAIVPFGTSPGLVILQPNDAMSGAHLDVVGVPYNIENGAVVAAGQPAKVLTLAEADTNLTLMTDNSGRVWVGATDSESPTDAVFFVLDRIQTSQ